MKVLDPGHRFLVKTYDDPTQPDQELVFMKREGAGYPGNVGHHGGTNCQEVIRGLISRFKYLNCQIPCPENERIIARLRLDLFDLEGRAATRHGACDLYQNWPDYAEIEDVPTCPTCGHIVCHGHS